MFFVKDYKALRLFGFQVCSTKSHEVLHRDTRRFLKWMTLREVHRGVALEMNTNDVVLFKR